MSEDDKLPEDGGAMFTESLHALGSDRNLASGKVVHTELAHFIDDLVGCDTEDDALRLIDRVAGIFSGVAPGWQRVPGWASQSGLGASLAAAYGVNDRQYIHNVVREALAVIAVEVIELAQRSGDNDADLEAGTDRIVQKAVAAFTGAHTLIEDDLRG